MVADVGAAAVGARAVVALGCACTIAAATGFDVTVDPGVGVSVGVVGVAVAEARERGLPGWGLAAPISKARGAIPNGAAGVAGVVGVGLTEPAGVATVSVLVAAVVTAGPVATAVAGFGAVVTLEGVGAEVAGWAGTAVAGRAAAAGAVVLVVCPVLEGVRSAAVCAECGELGEAVELEEVVEAFFGDLGAFVLGCCGDVSVSSCAVAGCPAGDPALMVDVPVVAEPPPVWGAELVTGCGDFAGESLSVPAGLVDFVDGETSVSACARPDPDARARPSVNVAAPVPSQRYGSRVRAARCVPRRLPAFEPWPRCADRWLPDTTIPHFAGRGPLVLGLFYQTGSKSVG